MSFIAKSVSFLLQQRLLTETIYGLLILISCAIIYFRTRDAYALSHHKGLKYFRNAFFFYVLAFVFRFLGVTKSITMGSVHSSSLLWVLFTYTISIASLYFVYSVVWRYFDSSSKSKRFDFAELFLHAFSLIVVLLSIIVESIFVVYLVQVLLFLLATIISFRKCKKTQKKKCFIHLYSFVLLLLTITWIINFIVFLASQHVIHIFPLIAVLVDLITVVVFIVIAYGVVRATGRVV